MNNRWRQTNGHLFHGRYWSCPLDERAVVIAENDVLPMIPPLSEVMANPGMTIRKRRIGLSVGQTAQPRDCC
jgi:hypothetical protein